MGHTQEWRLIDASRAVRVLCVNQFRQGNQGSANDERAVHRCGDHPGTEQPTRNAPHNDFRGHSGSGRHSTWSNRRSISRRDEALRAIKTENGPGSIPPHGSLAFTNLWRHLPPVDVTGIPSSVRHSRVQPFWRRLRRRRKSSGRKIRRPKARLVLLDLDQ